MKDYPSIEPDSLDSALTLMRYITKERTNDVKDFDNIKNLFMSGRKVGKIPTGAAAASDDRLGDFNYDSNYWYIVVNNSGTAEWRRIAYTAW